MEALQPRDVHQRLNLNEGGSLLFNASIHGPLGADSLRGGKVAFPIIVISKGRWSY